MKGINVSEVVEIFCRNYATPVLPNINLQFLQQTRIGLHRNRAVIMIPESENMTSDSSLFQWAWHRFGIWNCGIYELCQFLLNRSSDFDTVFDGLYYSGWKKSWKFQNASCNCWICEFQREIFKLCCDAQGSKTCHRVIYRSVCGLRTNGMTGLI